MNKVDDINRYLGKDRIKWARVPAIEIKSRREWNQKIDYFKKNGTRVQRPGSKTVLHFWLQNDSWNWDRDKYGTSTIYAAYTGIDQFIKYIYKENKRNNVTGIQAVQAVDKLIKEKQGVSLRVAFGTVDNTKEFKGFQYSPIDWLNKRFVGINLENIYKADISSAYPYQVSKILPDSHTAVKFEGRLKPTEEYPFAYYIRSNQLAIYNELDTADYKDHPLNKEFNDYKVWLRKNKPYTNRFHYIEIGDEQTILMKASKYSLEEEMKELYKQREVSEEAKGVSVKFIGALSSLKRRNSNNNPARHITAVVYARHLAKMMYYYDILNNRNAPIIEIATDSIIWASKKNIQIYDTTYKQKHKIGDFNLEIKKGKGYFAAQGVYAIQDPEKPDKLFIRHQRYSEEDLAKIKFTKPSDIQYIEKSAQILFNQQTGYFNYKGWEGEIE